MHRKPTRETVRASTAENRTTQAPLPLLKWPQGDRRNNTILAIAAAMPGFVIGPSLGIWAQRDWQHWHCMGQVPMV